MGESLIRPYPCRLRLSFESSTFPRLFHRSSCFPSFHYCLDAVPESHPQTGLIARAVLFDVDGVLVDSARCVERQWGRWAKEHGMDPRHIVPIAHGRRPVETMRLIAPSLNAEAEAAAITAREEEDLEGVKPVPGADALLRALGDLPWAIVTSGTRRLAANRLRHVGITLPPVVVAADDVVHGKPDPECYLAAARKLGIPPSEAVVIEDTPAGIEAAQHASMKVIAVATTHPMSALKIADIVAGSLAELRVTSAERRNGCLTASLWCEGPGGRR